MGLGNFPGISLKQARALRDEAKNLLSQGTDPIADKKQTLADEGGALQGFEATALEWYKIQSGQWSASHSTRIKTWLDKDVIPYLKGVAMADISAQQLLRILHRVEDRGSIETAHRIQSVLKQVWDYWLPTTNSNQRNIADGLAVRLKPYRKEVFAAITDPARFSVLLKAIRAYKGSKVVRVALALAPLLYQRPGNLRMMEWTELDLEKGLWTIPSAKMKRSKAEKEHGEDHVVPLPSQAIELLQELKPYTGRWQYVFAADRNPRNAISDNSVRKALISLDFIEEQSWHGFRASARTMLVDELEFDPLAIEASLAHTVKDANGRSYNRTTYLAKRKHMAQVWGDYLDHLASSNSSKPFRTPDGHLRALGHLANDAAFSQTKTAT